MTKYYKNRLNNYIYLILTIITLNSFHLFAAATIKSEERIPSRVARKLNKELIEAAKLGNKLKVENLIERGANVNLTNDKGETALYKAAQGNHIEIAGLLINKGADVNADDDNGWTPLIWASYSNHEKMVELLINSKADLDLVNEFGYTALMQVVKSGQKKTVELLLKAGSDLGKPDKNNQKVIDLALENRNFAIQHSGEPLIGIRENIFNIVINEPTRRAAVIKMWLEGKEFKQISRKLAESVNNCFIFPLAQLIFEYYLDYINLPIDYRLTS